MAACLNLPYALPQVGRVLEQEWSTRVYLEVSFHIDIKMCCIETLVLESYLSYERFYILRNNLLSTTGFSLLPLFRDVFDGIV
jgi:hypothetical protein